MSSRVNTDLTELYGYLLMTTVLIVVKIYFNIG